MNRNLVAAVIALCLVDNGFTATITQIFYFNYLLTADVVSRDTVNSDALIKQPV